LARRYRSGKPTVRGWLVEAGVSIRSRGDGGYHRQLSPPSADRLAASVAAGRTVPQLAAELKVSPQTVRTWLREAGIAIPKASLKDRPRGSAAALARPPAEQLRELYVEQQLSLQAVGERLGVGVHLVRMWLREAGIVLRAPGGSRGRTAARRPLKPIPPAEELREQRVRQRLPLRVIAEQYGVHPQTVARWCRSHGLPARLPPAGASEDAELVERYRAEDLSAAEIARRTGATATRVLNALHNAGVQIDPQRQAHAVRAAARARAATTPSLPPEDTAWALGRYQEGWACRRIAEALGTSTARVRRELRRHRVPGRARPLTGPASRASRTGTPVEQVRRLYVDSQWPAVEVGARVNAPGWMVLRTAHAHGLPVRQGGFPTVSATVALIEALYADVQIQQALTKHGIAARPAVGDIADRFPDDPVPLTRELLEDLYVEAGCSSNQIELLTGQSQAVVRSALHRQGIPTRAEHMSPALRRLREAARTEFLAGIVSAYHEVGSTRLVAERYSCATATAHRWLTLAGVSLPSRGQWPRRRPQSA
jgi:transposase